MLIDSAGGGGYGAPAERERELVLADVRAGFVTTDSARSLYGVDVEAEDGAPSVQPPAP